MVIIQHVPMVSASPYGCHRHAISLRPLGLDAVANVLADRGGLHAPGREEKRWAMVAIHLC